MGLEDVYYAGIPKPKPPRFIERYPEPDNVLFVNGDPGPGHKKFSPDGAFGRDARRNAAFTQAPSMPQKRRR